MKIKYDPDYDPRALAARAGVLSPVKIIKRTLISKRLVVDIFFRTRPVNMNTMNFTQWGMPLDTAKMLTSVHGRFLHLLSALEGEYDGDIGIRDIQESTYNVAMWLLGELGYKGWDY
jgi:hypothetical protein